jgi:hypothetical protein
MMSPLMTLGRLSAIAGLPLLLASCAGHTEPSAGVRETVDPSWLAGTWRGTRPTAATSSVLLTGSRAESKAACPPARLIWVLGREAPDLGLGYPTRCTPRRGR